MQKDLILQKTEPAVTGRGCFVVDLALGKDNDIVLTIEKEDGVVELADCEAVNDAFLDAFDRDVEDYSLTVTSAGLDQPFKIMRQYTKALGTQVEVSLRGGRKLVGELIQADEEGITLRHSEKRIVERKKKKVLVEVEERIPLAEVNSTVPHIEFK